MKEKKDKTIIILIVAVVLIITVSTILFFVFKRKETNKPANNNYPEYREKVSELLKEDNNLKKLFYSKVDASENPVTVDNSTYYLIDEKYGYNTIKQIYEKLSYIYSYNYRKNTLTDLNNYNSFMMLDDKLYINFKTKCNIPDFSEKLLNINSVDTENGIVKYSYNNKEYEVVFLKDVYLIDSSPFEC